MVYLGASGPLETAEDGAAGPGLRPLRADEERVRVALEQPFVYYVASTEGCGCRFDRWGEPPVDEEERAERATNQAFLRGIVRAALPRGPVEIFATWAGGEGEPPAALRRLAASELDTAVLVAEDVRVTIRPAADDVRR
jgi:hypothetical protein